MKPPKAFKVNPRTHGYSICMACREWKFNNWFHHEGIYWTLCLVDFEDYWYNTDVLLRDYKGF